MRIEDLIKELDKDDVIQEGISNFEDHLINLGNSVSRILRDNGEYGHKSHVKDHVIKLVSERFDEIYRRGM